MDVDVARVSMMSVLRHRSFCQWVRVVHCLQLFAVPDINLDGNSPRRGLFKAIDVELD